MESIRRELRVIRNNNGFPVLQRIIKWAIFLGVARKLRGTRWFRAWAFGLPIMGIAVHMFYGTRPLHGRNAGAASRRCRARSRPSA